MLALSGESGLAPPEPGLKADLQDALSSRQMLTDRICVKDGSVVEVDLHVDLTVDKRHRRLQDELEVKSDRRLSGFFLLGRWDYGQTLKAVDVVKALSDITEVENIEVQLVGADGEGASDVVTARFNEIIRPAVVDINFIYE